MHHPLPFRRHAANRARRFGAQQWSESARTSLEQDLRAAVRGEVRFDGASRALYATAGSNYRQVPIGVVIPRTVDDIVESVRIARAHGAPVLTRGGGTSLAGQCCNIAVLIDCSKYTNAIISLDPAGKRARVQPGLILDHLRQAAERHHLTFGPDPSTHDHCTLGGMIGNNSCGVHSVMAGKTDVNVEELDILLYDGTRMRVGATPDDEIDRIVAGGGRRGEIYAGLRALRDRYADAIRREFPDIPRRVSGLNLPWLLPEHGFNVARALVGSEGTCVTVLEATVRLVDSPPHRTLVTLGYPDVYSAADDVTRVMEYGPIGLEGMDDRLIEDIRHIGIRDDSLKKLPKGGGWLLVEFGGETKEEAEGKAQHMVDDLGRRGHAPTSKIFEDEVHEEQIWKTREAGLGATAHVTSDHPTWEGWEDSSVPPAKLGDYLRDLRKLLDRYHYIGDFYGHFGQGCLHTRINFDLFSAPGIDKFRSFIEEAASLVVGYGGSLSGEHGDGQSKAEMLPKMFGPDIMRAFQEFKGIWDPDGRMNPGKLVDPYRIDENLRYGSDYDHPSPDTHFQFPAEHGSFARAMQRCVGVGECRRTDRGTMCPSFQVTREEMHSTRGRAHLLWEMLEGDPVEGMWQNEHVHEALGLCLACKGCKGDCPVHVDMATYKAEFLSHYYEGHWRPRTAWAFGLIYWWARLGSRVPSLVNLVTHAPGLSWLSKRIAGMPAERRVPAFAARTFIDWFHGREATASDSTGSRQTVLLWPDTFNNHFHPETAIAATELLESAGFEVMIPERSVCCGRPLYDYGLLTMARARLMDVLDAVREEIRNGVPIVVLEPSCAAVFHDELVSMLPNDEDAIRLSQQTFLLAQFVAHHRERFDLPAIDATLLFHGHCHQKAVFGVRDDKELLESLGARVEAPDTGCCGMAGSFGFEAEHYDVSRKVGERVLLPAVREAHATTAVVADGFSCREQIAQLTDRRGLHLAQVLRLAQTHSMTGARPEQAAVVDHAAETATRVSAWAAAALVGVGAALAVRGVQGRQ
ncbi:MAG TPA: FAD-binding and (Fe-S)-binding domain-containing protein [Vicinamibacterales bacterium]|nr:FAD-binding and (Fe-S)-binding domain-containing protein [Vicinamibacterales bacterium]